MNNIIQKSFEGHAFLFREDGWFNATQAAKNFGKEAFDWLRTQDAKDYISGLSRVLNTEENRFLSISKGRGGATWMHPKLAVVFARFLNVDFAIWCDEQIEKIIHKDAVIDFFKLPPMEDAAKGIGIIFDQLRLSDSARLQGYGVLLGQYGLDTKMLPNYAIDAPVGTEIVGSSEPVLAATDLLKQHGIKMSAIAFNKILAHDGYLEKMSRHSSSGKTKHYQSVTEKGLQYGKNVTSDKNQKETQPQWYISRFSELLSVVGLLELKAA